MGRVSQWLTLAGLLGGAAAASTSPMPALHAQRATVAIAAASDLQTVMPEIVRSFEREHGIRARVSLGSSGNFFAQIQNGAPFDVFLSADVDYPTRLVAAGRADADSLYEYATGRLVLWTRSDSGVDVRRGLISLDDPRVKRIAIANPEHAPYGRAAVAALRHEQMYDRVKHKLVLGENISQTAQFAATGNAQAGLISLSLALGPALATGRYAEVPATFHPPIRQAAVVVSTSPNKAAARQLVRVLRSAETTRILQRFGFGPPIPDGGNGG